MNFLSAVNLTKAYLDSKNLLVARVCVVVELLNILVMNQVVIASVQRLFIDRCFDYKKLVLVTKTQKSGELLRIFGRSITQSKFVAK